MSHLETRESRQPRTSALRAFLAQQELRHIFIWLNVSITIVGTICTFLAGYFTRSLVTSPLVADFESSVEVGVGMLSLLGLLVANFLLVAFEARLSRIEEDSRAAHDATVTNVKAETLELRRGFQELSDVSHDLVREVRVGRQNELPDGLFRRLARSPLREYELSAARIVHGDQKYHFSDYYRAVRRRIHDLDPGDRIRAVCNDVRWEAPAATGYFEENFTVAQSGVELTRVFLVEPSDADPKLKEIMDKHRSIATAKPLYISPAELLRNRSQGFWVPRGVGFVIITRSEVSEVYVHFSRRERDQEDFGRRYTDQDIVESFEIWFEELSIQAKEYI